MSEWDDLIAQVRPYTVVPTTGLETTIRLTLEAIEKGIPGVLVECGVWRGGASFAMLLAQQRAFGEVRRPVWMYDSFQGMGTPSREDGEHANWWKKRSTSVAEDPDGQNYVTASRDEVIQAAAELGIVEHIKLIPGWYSETLTNQDLLPNNIAVLRIDCDWYEPTKLVYDQLAHRVSIEGAVIIDDYYTWEGCILATHEYLAENRLPWIIRTVDNHAGAYMHKREPTW